MLVDNLSPTPTPTPSASAGEPTPTPSATPSENPSADPSGEPSQPPAPTPAPLSFVLTVAGNGTEGASNGSKNSASFRYPAGIALRDDGSLLVADQNNHRIRLIASDGTVSHFAGSGTSGYLEGAALSARFSAPTGIAVGPDGAVYIADHYNHRIRKIDKDGTVSTFAGKGTAGDTDGGPTQAEFRTPWGLAVDASGSVYVADQGNNLIRKISPEGQVSTLAGTVSGYADGDAKTEARFSGPYGLAVDDKGSVYVADRSNHAIRKISPDGQVTTFAGTNASGYVDGVGTVARFNFPWGVIVGPDSHLYVSDGENQRIRRIAPDGTVVTIAGNGNYGLASGMGYSPQTALETAFRYPAGLAMASSSVLYITDVFNHAVRKLY